MTMTTEETLDHYRKVVKTAAFIEANLETLAKVYEVGANSDNASVYKSLITDLKSLYPNQSPDAIAAALVTEACRVQYLKMMKARHTSHSIMDR